MIVDGSFKLNITMIFINRIEYGILVCNSSIVNDAIYMYTRMTVEKLSLSPHFAIATSIEIKRCNVNPIRQPKYSA